MIEFSNMSCFLFFLYFFIFLLGLIVGSFLNSFIYRLSLPRKIEAERSFCPHCHHSLSWKDLIPVLSFLVLKGKCRYCQKPISLQYPLVELVTGILFVSIFHFEISTYNLQPTTYNFATLLYYWVITCFLIIIFVYDLKHYIIPDKIVYPAIALSFFYQLFIGILNFGFVSDATLRGVRFASSGFWISDFKTLINPLLSAILASAFFISIVLVSRGKWMGVGDIKLAFLMGLFLGFPDVLVALFFAFLIGAIIGIGLIIFKKKKLKSEVPFGPFLVAGTFIALFWAKPIIDWYLRLFW